MALELVDVGIEEEDQNGKIHLSAINEPEEVAPLASGSQDNARPSAWHAKIHRWRLLYTTKVRIITSVGFIALVVAFLHGKHTARKEKLGYMHIDEDDYTIVDNGDLNMKYIRSEVPSMSPTGASSGEPTIASSESINDDVVKVTLQDGVMYEVIGEKIFHDKTHFTQGLTYSNVSDTLFESNGLYGRSSLCKLNPKFGNILKCVRMESKFFAEGMQVYGEAGNEKLIQLTWKERTGFIYDASSLEMIESFTFTTTLNEGWGISYDKHNHEFIVSDGSSTLHFWDADSLKEKRRLKVTRQNGMDADELNELEFVKGKVLANVWYEDTILVINPSTGECEKEYDFSSLWPKRERAANGADVLNGISVSKEEGILYITGSALTTS